MEEGRNLYNSCIKLVKAGYTDEQIADQLGYKVPEIQESIDMARALLASLRLPIETKLPSEDQTDPTASAEMHARGQSETAPSAERSQPRKAGT